MSNIPRAIEPAFSAEAFALTPDPTRLFLSRDHAEALAGLRLALEYRRGFAVVAAEVGMGKTTLAYSLLASLGAEVRTAYIANTRVPFDGLLRLALQDFGVECADRDRASLLSALNAFLLDCAARDQIAVLVVDEAQSLDDDTFENLRLLSNVETYAQKLLQIILLGQPELDGKLRQSNLRQIADRIAIRVNINPLDDAECRQYVEHRLTKAGGSIEMFSEGALRALERSAEGVPRRINILCHNALLLAYAGDSEQVTRGMMEEAVRELRGGKLVRRRKRFGLPITNWIARWWPVGAAAVIVGGAALHGVPSAFGPDADVRASAVGTTQKEPRP